MVFRNLLFFIAASLLVGWILGVFVWPHDGKLIHIWLLLAIAALVLGLVVARKSENDA
jgi:hypothetical protein